ncbi:S1/P1 nuclease, partial [Arthrospira platensis SPKY1]|nr:S1/P1 nuclease [Arthrospira platensis SPKY1]
MKKTLLHSGFLTILILLSFHSVAHAWGPIGHYVIGMLAEQQMKKKTIKKVEKILNNESISGVGVWMDNIRSDKNYDYTNTWHWVTTIEGNYDPTIQEEKGDAFKALHELIANLKSGKLSRDQERDQLRML